MQRRMRIIVVDSNIVIAALNRRDRLHQRAKRLLVEILRGHYGVPCVTDYIVDETLTYMQARVGAEAALRAGRLFFDEKAFRILPVSIEIFYAAWETFKKHLPRLSFTDAVTLEAAKAYRADYIATFDEELAKHYNSLP